jgi:hypothetical protein
MRKQPDKRIILERIADNQNRRMLPEMPVRALREQLAGRVGYEGSGAHKGDPYSWGIEPYRGRRRDRTYCDLNAKFHYEDRHRIKRLLKRGVLGGLISENAIQGDPTMLWTLDHNGWIYELRITHPGRAIYHGYPVLPSDPFARKVIARLSVWASDESEDAVKEDEDLEAALLAAERRYA